MLPALIAAVSAATTAGAAAPPPSADRGARVRGRAGTSRAAPGRIATQSGERTSESPRGSAQAGLRVGTERFAVPGKGTSRDVIGIRDVPARCLVIVMAHADSVPPAPGADDNASGVGTIVALAPALAQGPAPKCDTWLVATGSEERPYTRQPDHLGASALVRRLKRTRRLGRRPPRALPRRGWSRHALRAALPGPKDASRRGATDPRSRRKQRAVNVTWLRDSATGNSDHRELALAGAPATKLGVPDEPVRHTAADTADRLQRGAFARVLRVVWPLLREVG